jgi:hypothetical protein
MPSRTGADGANERLRRRYRPVEVRVVFIAESPPAGGTFFYRGNSKLYYATREAFATAVPAFRQNEDFLSAFKQLGCYLDDLSPRPVDHLDMNDPERREARREGVEPLARRMRRWSPRAAVVVMKAIVPHADAALARAGHGDIPREALPFPARHAPQYIEQLTEVVSSWRRRRIFHPL